ncbi:MAG: hypothetical protein JWN59_32, partial [Sphingomonas bacterium]|nr:hypothetical protein [Sphingomonas bacterium]
MTTRKGASAKETPVAETRTESDSFG